MLFLADMMSLRHLTLIGANQILTHVLSILKYCICADNCPVARAEPCPAHLLTFVQKGGKITLRTGSMIWG